MNVLIVNKYHFVRGGPERYLFSVTDLLQRAGHKVVPLAVRFDENDPSPFSEDFLEPPARIDQSRFKDFSLGLLGQLRMLFRSIYSIQAYRRVAKLVRRERIDVVYLLNICNYISPSVIDAARNAGARVVMRLSDFNFACASYHFLREGRTCTLCQDGMHHALRYRCAHGSLKVSLARVLAMRLHRVLGLYQKVDKFVTPSRFMAEALVRFGIPSGRIRCLPSFVGVDKLPQPEGEGNAVVYCGRLDHEKGVDVLLRAWAGLGSQAPPLRILGTGEAAGDLKHQAERSGLRQIRFEGFLEREAVLRAVCDARLVVAPSLWPENSPMAVYEAMACGRPVVASDVGGLQDQIQHEVSGLLVSPGDAEALGKAVLRLWNQPQLAIEMGLQARRRMELDFSPVQHLQGLLEVLGAVRPSSNTENRENATQL